MAENNAKGGGLKSWLQNLWQGGKARKDAGIDADELGMEVAEDEGGAFREGEVRETTGALEDNNPEPREPDENERPAAGNPLYELYTRRKNMPVVQDENTLFHYSVFMENEAAPTSEQRSWMSGFEREARSILQKTQNGDEETIDAKVMVHISQDKMQAFLFALPPTLDGAPLMEDAVLQVLNDAGVLFGIDEAKVAAFCQQQRYFTLTEVAHGEAPIDGKDGYVVDHFKREFEIHLTVREDNTVDYKDLGWLQTVEEGQAICDMVPPTPATPGRNARGDEVKGRDGVKAVPPKGQGTTMNEEETSLVATLEGVVSFDGGRFRVDPLLILKGDVDTATGNIETVGDLLIHGDILEGFTVEATGNITVQGMVEGATVTAGGDIQVGRGMNGNSRGVMTAKGEVRSKFIENGTVNAGGKITCDTIINSTVSSDTAIIVKTGRGTIIGGSITALERIEVISIGNQSNRSIEITMGSTVSMLKDKDELESQKTYLAIEVDEIEKNLSFLNAGVGRDDEQTQKTIDELKLRLNVLKMQQANVEKRLKTLEQKQTDNTNCRLRADILYPPIHMTIGGVAKTIRQMAFNAVVYLLDGDIHVGNI